MAEADVRHRVARCRPPHPLAGDVLGRRGGAAGRPRALRVRGLAHLPGDRASAAGVDVRLPFEGDNMLSIILSKAAMLADDDKITDPSILSQLER